MDNRKLTCMVAAGFMGVTLTAAATHAFAGPREVVIQGARIDPVLQRSVSYRDLNLAERPGQKSLKARIHRTASALCYDLNGLYFHETCTNRALRSTDGQVAQAIDRAKRQMAGLAVGPAIAISMVIGVQ
ncbi:MAG: UrcA family protein [Pseudomonadota bacterium]|nr:UrcA family protein [Pseudomonadota bacterium]